MFVTKVSEAVGDSHRHKTLCMCSELGEAGAGCIPARPASAYQVHTKNNRHTPVMVYDDLIIRNNTVLGYNTNRSRPVTVQYIHKPYSDLGSDYSFVLPYGF